MDRQVWRSALEAGNYELLGSDGRENAGMNGRVEAMEVDSPHLRTRDRYRVLLSLLASSFFSFARYMCVCFIWSSGSRS